MDGLEEDDVMIEAAPDGGTSGWAVCGGAAVISSATAVVRTTVRTSVDSLNTAFNVTNTTTPLNGTNVTTPAPVPATTVRNINYELCRTAMLEFPGQDDPRYVDCMNRGIPDFHPCLEQYFQGVNTSTFPSAIQEVCQFQLTPRALGLSAGNVYASSVTFDDEVGTRLEFIFVYISLLCGTFVAYKGDFIMNQNRKTTNISLQQ